MTVSFGSLFHSVIVSGKRENLKILLMSFRYNKKVKIMASWCSPFSIWNQMVLSFPIQETTVHLIHNGQPCVSSHACFKCVTLQGNEFVSRDQDPITRSGQFPYQTYVTALLRTSLFLDTFQGTFFPRKQNLHHVFERIRSMRYQTGKLNVIKRQIISF